MVTMVMMIVISLIVLGFAQISRREQTNSLNRQLSTQAFYAAETGINDAQNAINAAAANGTAITPKTGCTDNGNSTSIYYGKINYIVNSAQGVTYTCLLVSTQVSQLQKTLGVDQEWVVPIHPVDGSGADSPLPLGQLKFSWPPQDATVSTSASCTTTANGHIQNPTSDTWNCGYGALRIDLIPVPAGSNPSRQSLEANDMVVFAYPSTAGASYNYTDGVNSSSNSHQAYATCNAGGVKTCVLTVSSLNYPADTMYYARIHMLYRSTGTDIVKINAANNSVLFSGSQAQIDSTGKAQDVLRRIRVTVPIGSDKTQYSPYALLTRDSICKRYSIEPHVAPNYSVPMANTSDTSNGMCKG
jgi:hypothetical protein